MTDTTLSVQDMVSWIELASQRVTEHEHELTELDAAIGDADHGLNMRRGMSAAVQAVAELDAETVDAVLKKVALTLISSVGGASGPLYGTFFLRMARATTGRTELDLETLREALTEGVAGIAMRGKAVAGEKTMLDAWYPALSALGQADTLSGALAAAAEAAEHGRDETAPMVATKGRASYLVERSVGHIDPGAASTALIVKALADVAAGEDA